MTIISSLSGRVIALAKLYNNTLADRRLRTQHKHTHKTTTHVVTPAPRFPGRQGSIHPSPWLTPPGNAATTEHSAGKDPLSDVVWYYLRKNPNPQSARICLLTSPIPRCRLHSPLSRCQRHSDVAVPADRWRGPRGAAGTERLVRARSLQAFVKPESAKGRGSTHSTKSRLALLTSNKLRQ